MTLEELYNKVMSSREIMGKFVKASGTSSLAAFAKSYGCIATEQEIRRFFMVKCGEGTLEDDAVESVYGGASNFEKWINGIYNKIFGNGSNS